MGGLFCGWFSCFGGVVFGVGVDAREAGQVLVRVILLSPNSLAVKRYHNQRIHIWSLIANRCRNDRGVGQKSLRGVGQYLRKSSALTC
jgi:hypothetical protein